MIWRPWSKAERAQWRPWFAWRPVRVDFTDGTHAWVWLERVERSWVRYCDEGNCCWSGRYRLPNTGAAE